MKKRALEAVNWLVKNSAYLVWSLSAGAILGSLYFSEIKQFPPCELCWWTRILIYPIAFIMSVALMKKPQIYWRGYVLVLAIPAWLLGAFHSLLQWGIISEEVTSCSLTSAVSCADPEINWFGFVTIPFLGLLTSSAIIILTLVSNNEGKLYKWLKKKLS